VQPGLYSIFGVIEKPEEFKLKKLWVCEPGQAWLNELIGELVQENEPF
jgi:hypothetical protein